MKGITYCGECADYDHKKHRCKRGANRENNPQDKFYDDCPLPDVEPVQDKPDLMLYERETAAGEPYIVAKAGLMVQALIQPLSVTDDKLLDQLETLARELRQMMQTDETDTDTHRALPWAVDENGEVI